jgi:hypothetical protein
MKRTRIVFFAVIGLAIIVVASSLLLKFLGRRVAVRPPEEKISVRVVCALPVEPWVREAAKRFNKEGRELEGRIIEVSIIPMDGLTALRRWEREEMEPIPTAWIPDSRYLVELVNAVYKEKRGRDVFLTDGEYRARPIATSLFSWGIYQSRAEVLKAKYGEIDWQAIHDAATAKGGWPELGGKPEWGYFKLVVPNPRRNVGGLMAMVAAAGEYYGKTKIEVSDVTNPDFQSWLYELMSSMTDLSAGAYTVEDLALFGYSIGDGGQLLESDLLVHMEGILTRWEDPLLIIYPKYLTWFDFPFTTWMGPETSALEKDAALEFERYLLSKEIQRLAVERGLRPANLEVPITGEKSLFTRWEGQGAMTIVPRATAMRPPDRDVLLALLRWFDLNIAR